jgi:hypothetical protein
LDRPEGGYYVKPELRSIGSLTAADFERFPVWLACHVADCDEPWYDETDEETFRPWTGKLPVRCVDGMYLVKATATLADGSSFPALLTPAGDDDLGLIQPYMFVRGRCFSFWGGMMGVSRKERDEFYAAVGVAAEAAFPIQFAVAPELAEGGMNVEVGGFYRRTLDLQTTVVER